MGLVAKVNGALALITWPFALYEVFAKNAKIPELKEKLQLRRDQLLAAVALELADELRPYWPKTSSRIIVEPNYESGQPSELSDDAIDSMKGCLESNEGLLRKAATLRRLAPRLFRLDGLCYWLIFSTAAESVAALGVWFFDDSVSDRFGMALLVVPILTAAIALVCAGVRQGFIYFAHKIIMAVED